MEQTSSDVRVRIAPSPTGLLHIGTARTALFNWLFAKKNGGKFILRIEDTDKERSKPEYEKDILDGLNWLGLEWDEFYKQSERTAIYKEHLEKLLKNGNAYWCFCGKEELEKEKETMQKNGKSPKYGGRCRLITPKTAETRRQNGEPAVIRFKMMKEIIIFSDLIRGEVEFNTTLFGDIVIAKDLETPLYNFSAVLDDGLMKISHIIRGEDHIVNTPKQIAIQKALNLPVPIYAHLPLILNPDRSKLSKRFNATSLNEYRGRGYLPEATVNFLALLGWHPEGDREVFSLGELAEKFEIERVQKGGAIFNEEKLDWFNGEYIKKMPEEELAEKLAEFAPEEWLKDKELFRRAVLAERERTTRLCDFKELGGFFFELPEYEAKLLIWKNTPPQKIKENLERVLKILEEASNEDEAEKKAMILAEEQGKGEVLWPTRTALSGKKASPGPFEIIRVIGLDESGRRLEKAICLLQQN